MCRGRRESREKRKKEVKKKPSGGGEVTRGRAWIVRRAAPSPCRSTVASGCRCRCWLTQHTPLSCAITPACAVTLFPPSSGVEVSDHHRCRRHEIQKGDASKTVRRASSQGGGGRVLQLQKTAGMRPRYAGVDSQLARCCSDRCGSPSEQAQRAPGREERLRQRR